MWCWGSCVFGFSVGYNFVCSLFYVIVGVMGYLYVGDV